MLTPGTFAARSFTLADRDVCVLLLFYTVESLCRERKTVLASISLATPVRTGSVLLGKSLAQWPGRLSWSCSPSSRRRPAFLLYQGKVGFRLWPFVLSGGCSSSPRIWAWTAFVMATLSLTRNRYATYAVGMAALIFTGYRLGSGKIDLGGQLAALRRRRVERHQRARVRPPGALAEPAVRD